MEPPQLPNEAVAIASAVRAHHGGRVPGESWTEVHASLAAHCALAIANGGFQATDVAWPDETRAALAAAPLGVLPEADLLGACGRASAQTAEEIASRANGSVWEPVLAIGWRTLTDLGRRDLIATALSEHDPASIVLADASLDAFGSIPWRRERPGNVGPWSVNVAADWSALLAIEQKANDGPLDTSDQATLQRLAEKAAPLPPWQLDDAARVHISARAASALRRCHIHGDNLPPCNPVLLPVWETAWLAAAEARQSGNLRAAVENLDRALATSPAQTVVRGTLAALVAESDIERALSLVNEKPESRELVVLRAQLLARAGHTAEAAESLAKHAGVGCEAARTSTPRGRARSEWRAQLLAGALAERRGDWASARTASQSALADEKYRALRIARLAALDQAEWSAMSAKGGWQGDVMKHRLERAVRELGERPLQDNHALFFRATALRSSAQARRDWQTLGRRRAWVDAEHRVGGGRIEATAQALLEAGEIQSAKTLLEGLDGTARERLAVADVLTVADAGAAAIAAALVRANTRGATHFGTWLLAAVALAAVGEVARATEVADEAVRRGAPSALRAIFAEGEVAHEDGALHLPAALAAILSARAGRVPDSRQIRAALQELPRGADAAEFAPAANRALAELFENERWDEVRDWAGLLENANAEWADELAIFAKIGLALARAQTGEFAPAVDDLAAAATRPART